MKCVNFSTSNVQNYLGHSKDDTMNAIGCFYMEVLREIRLGENIKVDCCFGRTVCKNCKRLLLSADTTPAAVKLRLVLKK